MWPGLYYYRMKTILLAAALLGASGPMAHAQRLALGFRAGANFSNYVRAGTNREAQIIGVLAGFTGTVPLNPAATMALQTELLYSGKGSSVHYLRSSTQPGTQRLHTLELPLLLQRRSGGLELEAGPQLSFVLAQRTVQEDALGNQIVITGTENLNRTQVGFILGAGYRGPATGLRLALQPRPDGSNAPLRSLQLGFSAAGQLPAAPG